MFLFKISTEAKLWITEEEMVDSVHDLRASCFFKETTHFPNFDLLNARIAFALNRIIQNCYFSKEVCPEEQKDQR